MALLKDHVLSLPPRPLFLTARETSPGSEMLGSTTLGSVSQVTLRSQDCCSLLIRCFGSEAAWVSPKPHSIQGGRTKLVWFVLLSSFLNRAIFFLASRSYITNFESLNVIVLFLN